MCAFYLLTVSIVRHIEKGLDEVKAAPGEDLLVFEVGLHFEDLRGGCVTCLLGEAEYVWVPQNLLK